MIDDLNKTVEPRRIFSVNYVACLQSQFEAAMDEDDLDLAIAKLREIEKMPFGLAIHEQSDRLTVLMEGYRAIVESYGEESKPNELSRYRALGDIDELEGLQRRLACV